MEFMTIVVIALNIWLLDMNKWVDEAEEHFKWEIKVNNCTRLKEFDVHIQCNIIQTKTEKCGEDQLISWNMFLL